MVVEPSYRDREEEGNDIALVLLDKDVPVQPIPVNSVALDSSWNGSSSRVIGYGLTGFSDEPTTTSGERREMTTLLQEVRPTLLTIGDANHQVKGGDSGGPALMRVDGVERIVGLTSYTSPTCLPGDCFTRVDRWGAFIAPYLGGKPVGAPPAKPQCQYACSDYGYGPGECDQGWYCDGACVTQTGCQP